MEGLASLKFDVSWLNAFHDPLVTETPLKHSKLSNARCNSLSYHFPFSIAKKRERASADRRKAKYKTHHSQSLITTPGHYSGTCCRKSLADLLFGAPLCRWSSHPSSSTKFHSQKIEPHHTPASPHPIPYLHTSYLWIYIHIQRNHLISLPYKNG